MRLHKNSKRQGDVPLTISGPPCGGSTTVARLLANRLSRPLIEAGPRYRQEAITRGLPQEETWSIEPNRLKEIDEEMLNSVRINPRVVWEGRLTGWFARWLDNAIRIWCSAPFPVRAARYAAREGVDVDTASQRIQIREASDRDLFARLYGPNCNIEDLRNYDVIVSTEQKSPSAIVQGLLDDLRQVNNNPGP